MKKKLYSAISIMAITAVLLAGCGGGAGTTTAPTQSASSESAGNSGEARVFQLGHIDPSSDQNAYQIFAMAFKKNVQELSDGTMDVEVHGDAQLGGEIEMFEAMTLGDLDMALITNNYYSNFNKNFDIFNLPFLFSDYDTEISVVDDPEVMAFLQDQLLTNNGVRLLGYSDTGFRYIVNNVRPVTEVADLSGIKIRLPETTLYVNTFQALGANPTTMAFSEAYTAVQQGTVDGLEITASAIYSAGYYEICKYLSKTRHFASPITLDMSDAVWQTLSEEEQNILTEAAKKARDEARPQVYANEGKFFDEMEEAGCQLNEIKDSAEFRQACESVYENAKKDIDPDFYELVMSKIGQ